MYILSPRGELIYNTHTPSLLVEDISSNDVRNMILNVKQSSMKLGKHLNKGFPRVKSVHIKGKNHLFCLYSIDNNSYDLAFYVRFHAEIEAQTIDMSLIDSEMEGIILEMMSLLENLMLK